VYFVGAIRYNTVIQHGGQALVKRKTATAQGPKQYAAPC
jgi:hypothetical protein